MADKKAQTEAQKKAAQQRFAWRPGQLTDMKQPKAREVPDTAEEDDA